VAVALPFLVSSISAVDYNGDGLLDVYLGTYGPEQGGQATSLVETMDWAQHFLPNEVAAQLLELRRSSHSFLNRAGPPNLLLVNTGEGHFETAPENESLQGWSMTFQSSWADYDNDDDPDLYVCNDFGPDQLYRNDGDQGFTNVTELAGLTTLGFGMGVSWGDYDNDRQLDLYVSNMFSKAGARITGQIAGIDERMRAMAAGNFLYRAGSDRFELKSAEANPRQAARAGWAWGGQFVDFDNDGFLDIYVPNGFYTAPASVAVDIDL
jgi:hypothetical protein